MPVDDHAIHPRTIEAAGTLWGCHSSVRPEMAPGYWAPDGYKIAQIAVDGTKAVLPKMSWIPHTNSTECKSRLTRDTDPKCKGCNQCK